MAQLIADRVQRAERDPEDDGVEVLTALERDLLDLMSEALDGVGPMRRLEIDVVFLHLLPEPIAVLELLELGLTRPARQVQPTEEAALELLDLPMLDRPQIQSTQRQPALASLANPLRGD